MSMATRASGGAKNSSRTRASAARGKSSGSAPRKRSSGGAKGGGAKGGGASRGRPPQKNNDPFLQLIRGLFQLVVKLYSLAAVAVGSVFRAYGQGARDLDQEHRRDGLGLALLGSSIVLASV